MFGGKNRGMLLQPERHGLVERRRHAALGGRRQGNALRFVADDLHIGRLGDFQLRDSGRQLGLSGSKLSLRLADIGLRPLADLQPRALAAFTCSFRKPRFCLRMATKSL